MTSVHPTSDPVVPVRAAGITGSAETSSYVDWPAIIAGAVLAAAISLLLMTFGASVGLSLTEPLGHSDNPFLWFAIALAIWVVWVQVSSFMIGGYVTGRMRRRIGDSTEHESDVRDGIHGLLVWGTGLVLSAILALGGLGALAGGVGAAAGGAAQAVAENINEPFEATMDVLFRGDTTPADGEAVRGELTRIVVNGVTGEGVSAQDRDYLIGVVAARTGLTEAEVEARVDDVIARAQAIQDDIAEAAERARVIGILAAFLAAASLVVSAAGAYFAAGMGGSHRDKHTVIPFFAVRR